MSESSQERSGPGGWIEVRLQGPLAGLEVFADFLNERGAGGAIFSESPGSPGCDMVTGFVPLPEAGPALVEELKVRARTLSEEFPGQWGSLTITEVRDQDWAESWREKLEPLWLEPGVWIVPTFKEVPPHDESEIVIRLDPGMAFGTGRHETTRHSIKFLADSMQKGAHTVLDLGTGSGVLAIAAALAGAGRVLAMDVDGHALEVARENAQINAVQDKIELRQGVSRPDEDLAETFHLVLANLYAESLVKLMPFIKRHLSERGSAVLSGILADREQKVSEAAAESGLEIKEREQEKEWVTLVVQPAAKRS
ncbi:MAG: 50S ribosomal protein L11 methyltransferase [bacterium]